MLTFDGVGTFLFTEKFPLTAVFPLETVLPLKSASNSKSSVPGLLSTFQLTFTLPTTNPTSTQNCDELPSLTVIVRVIPQSMHSTISGSRV